MSWAVTQMTLALGIVFVLLFLFMRVMKKARMITGDASGDVGIRVLTSKLIAPQKYISLVEIGGEVLAIGVSDAQITLLGKIENKEFVEKVMAQHPGGPLPFSIGRLLSARPKWFGQGLLRISHGK